MDGPYIYSITELHFCLHHSILQENVTGANKLACPITVDLTVAPTEFAFIRHFCN